jgi:cytochrome c oxidase subunit 3/cytochrome o ubiquinol oxidase subunit 3
VTGKAQGGNVSSAIVPGGGQAVGYNDSGGHDAAHDHHEEEHHTSMGLNNVKLLMWTFIASECMLFGTLIAIFLAYLNKARDLEARGLGELWQGPLPHEIYDIPYTSVSAFVLLLSSLTMVLALAAAQSNNQRQLRIWLLATALLGLVFLGGQYFEFTTFREGIHHEAVWLDTSQFGASFFTLTGFHGAHVTVGAVWLLSLWIYSLRRGIPASKSLMVEIAGLYWHFVDVVWIVIFTVVYLAPTALGL